MPIRDLATLHTKQLLTLLDDARAFGPAGHVWRDLPDPLRRSNRVRDHTGHAHGMDCVEGSCFTLDEIKAELATREHVPNKAEARAIRQRKARSHP